MKTLQNQFYLKVVDTCMQANEHFQLNVPAIAISNETIYSNRLNTLAPYALTANFLEKDTFLFFNQYSSVINALEYPPEEFVNTIGEENNEKWEKYLATISPKPKIGEYGKLFQKWGVLNITNQAAYLECCQILLKWATLADAKNKLKPYEQSQSDLFSIQLKDLESELNRSVSTTINFDSAQAASDVANTWTNGFDIPPFGLWNESSVNTLLNKKFANHPVKLTITFEKWCFQVIRLGDWYNSGMLFIAYSTAGNFAPWPTKPTKTWKDYFDVQQGTFAHVYDALLFVKGVQIELTSDASFTDAEINRIKVNASSGLWPFYIPDMEHDFQVTSKGGLKISSTQKTNSPLQIGGKVKQIQKYVTAG